MDVLYPRCAGLDVHKDSVVAGVRLAGAGPAKTEVRTFDTTTPGLLTLSAWLTECGCTDVAMGASGVYWKPVWHVLSDSDFTLVLANAGHVKNVPGRKTDVADALWLADLLAHGLIRASFVPEPAAQATRALVEDHHCAMCLGGQPQEGQLPASPVPAAAPPARAQEGDLRRRRLDPHRAVYHMLRDGTCYADLGADYVHRHSPEDQANRLACQITKLGSTCVLTSTAATSVSV